MYVGVALVWLVLLAKLPVLARGWREQGRRTYWLAIFFLAVCITADRDPIYWAMSAATGIPNLAHGVSYAAAITGGFLAQLFLLYSYDRRRLDRELPWRRGVLAVGLLLYWALFAYGPAQLPTDPAVPHLPPEGPTVAGFRLVLAALVSWSMTEVSWLAWRFSGLAGHRPLRQGMRIVSLGCALVVVRVLIEYGLLPLWAAGTGWTLAWSYSGLLYDLNLLAMGGAALMAVGTALPTLSRRRSSIVAFAEQRAARRALLPLWSAMRTVTPALSNVRREPKSFQLPAWTSTRDLLYRMVAEIRDGYVVLWPYRDGCREDRLLAEGAAMSLSGTDLAAYVDAGSLHQAMQAHANGRTATRRVEARTSPGGDSFEAEVEYLVAVAHRWRRLRPAEEAAAAETGVRPVLPLTRTGPVP